MGRETFLLPVRWEGGWPRFLDPGEAMPPLVRRPDLPTDTAIDRSAWSDDFDAPALSPEWIRSEEHTSELQSLMRISYAVFCLTKKNTNTSTSSATKHAHHR